MFFIIATLCFKASIHLKEKLPLPSLSVLKKLAAGDIELLKANKLLLEEEKVNSDCILMLDEMYLQKFSEYSGGKYVGLDEKCNFFKIILVFMIVSLKKSIPYVIKFCPQTEINGDIVFLEVKESLSVLKSAGFNVRSIVAGNHSTNVSGYGQLVKCFGTGKAEEDHFIVYEEKKISLMYDSVHLLNIQNNLLNSKRFIFPAFHFNGLIDPISVTAGEISWYVLHEVYKKDEKLSGNLRKAHKLTFQTLHRK